MCRVQLESRVLCGTIGISISQAVISSVSGLFHQWAYEVRRLTLPPQTLREKLSHIPEFTGDTSPAALAQGVSHLKDIPVSRFGCTTATSKEAANNAFRNQNPVVRRAIIHAFTMSISSLDRNDTTVRCWFGSGYAADIPRLHYRTQRPVQVPFASAQSSL